MLAAGAEPEDHAMDIGSPSPQEDKLDRVFALQGAILEAYFMETASVQQIKKAARAAGFTEEEVDAAMADLDRNRYATGMPSFAGDD